MRDNHEGLPEILDAYQRDGHYFGVVRVSVDDERRALEFGIQEDGYRALRRILQARPFEQTGVKAYRYFFVPAFRASEDKTVVSFEVRIEQGQNCKQFWFEGPHGLVQNLMWFFQLETQKTPTHVGVASSLRVVPTT